MNTLRVQVPVTVVNGTISDVYGFMEWETTVPMNWFMMDTREDQMPTS